MKDSLSILICNCVPVKWQKSTYEQPPNLYLTFGWTYHLRIGVKHIVLLAPLQPKLTYDHGKSLVYIFALPHKTDMYFDICKCSCLPRSAQNKNTPMQPVDLV